MNKAFLAAKSVVVLRATHTDNQGRPVRECHKIKCGQDLYFVVFCDMKGVFYHVSLYDWNRYFDPVSIFAEAPHG